MRIKMVEASDHWIYALLKSFDYQISPKSTEERLVATRTRATGLVVPSDVTVVAHFYWDTDGLSLELATCPPSSLDAHGDVRDLYYTFIGRDASDGVNENIARHMFLQLEEATGHYFQALRGAQKK